MTAVLKACNLIWEDEAEKLSHVGSTLSCHTVSTLFCSECWELNTGILKNTLKIAFICVHVQVRRLGDIRATQTHTEVKGQLVRVGSLLLVLSGPCGSRALNSGCQGW